MKWKSLETKSHLIAVKNNAIRINYVKAKINKTQHDNKCTLDTESDETINIIVSRNGKLAQKE